MQTRTPACSAQGPLGASFARGAFRSSSLEGEAHLGLMPGTFSALEAPVLPLKESLSILLPLRDGAESEMV